jgi:O-antigen ligase
MYKLIARILLFLSVLTLNEQYSQVLFAGLPLTPKKLFAGALLGLAALKAAIRPHRMPRSGKNYAVLAFGLAGIPSYAMSYLMGIPLRDVVLGATSFYSIVLLYFLIAYVVEDERDLEVVIWASILGAALVGVSTVLGIGGQHEGYYTRAGGLGRNPNLAATYSVTGMVLGLLLFLEQPRAGFRRVALVGLVSVILIGVLSSLSRTGFVCMLAVGGFLLVRSGRLDLLRFALPVMALLAVGVVFLAPEQYFERISTTGQQAEDLATGNLANRRILGWWEGLKAFGSSPVVGVGRMSLPTWIDRNNPDVGEITPHSSYIFVLGTMGLSGFVPWAVALLLNWRDFSRVRRWARMFRWRRDPALNRLALRALFLQGAFLVWLTASVFSPFADDEGLWLLLALGTAISGLARERALALAADGGTGEPEPVYGFGVPAGAPPRPA